MLNELEEKILKYLIKNGSSDNVDIILKDENGSDVMFAVQTLSKKGLVKNTSTLSGASAILLPDGKYYFEQQKRCKFGLYYDKIRQIELHVDEAERLKGNGTQEEIKNFVLRMLSVYCKNIPNEVVQSIKMRISIYSNSGYELVSSLHEELDETIEILKNILTEIKIEATRNSQAQFINNNNVNLQVNIEVSLSQTIQNLNGSNLTPEEFQAIVKLLSEIEDIKGRKDKKSIWEKIKNVLRYLADKSIDAGIAVLPYIVQILTQCRG